MSSYMCVTVVSQAVPADMSQVLGRPMRTRAATTATATKTSLKNLNSPCFKLYCTYPISFNSSNVGIFFESWILKDCIELQEKKRKSLSCVHVLPHKTWISAFSRRSRAVAAKKCTKRPDAHAKLLFANLNLLLFCLSRCRRCCLRWCYTRRFATTILSETERCNIVTTLFGIVTTLFQHCNAVLR